MKPNMDTTNCILVQDVKSQPHDLHGSNTKANPGSLQTPTAYPTEESIQTSTSDHSASTGGLGAGGVQNSMPSLQLQHQQQLLQQQQPHSINQQTAAGVGLQDATHLQDQSYTAQHQHQQQQQQQQQQQLLKWPQVVELKELNEFYHANIPPYQFWNLEFRNKHPAFIRFNFTLPWGANFAVYSRRNVAPSVTQHDFAEFIKGGRIDSHLRHRRDVPHGTKYPLNMHVEPVDDYDLQQSPVAYQRNAQPMLNEDNWNEDDTDSLENTTSEEVFDIETPLDSAKFLTQRQLNEDKLRKVNHTLYKRSAMGVSDPTGGLPALDMDTMMVNVSLLQYLDTGLWFISVYNDELVAHSVTLIVEEAEGVSTTCPNDCSGRGSCYLGKCDCIDGYQGADCSKSKFPITLPRCQACESFSHVNSMSPAK